MLAHAVFSHVATLTLKLPFLTSVCSLCLSLEHDFPTCVSCGAVVGRFTLHLWMSYLYTHLLIHSYEPQVSFSQSQRKKNSNRQNNLISSAVNPFQLTITLRNSPVNYKKHCSSTHYIQAFTLMHFFFHNINVYHVWLSSVMICICIRPAWAWLGYTQTLLSDILSFSVWFKCDVCRERGK